MHTSNIPCTIFQVFYNFPTNGNYIDFCLSGLSVVKTVMRKKSYYFGKSTLKKKQTPINKILLSVDS